MYGVESPEVVKRLTTSKLELTLIRKMQSDESIVVPIVVFSLASFIGNFGVAITGFGMAIIFLFVYTIADLVNLVECSKCTLKDAVFFQTLALGSAIPLMLFNTRDIIKEHRSKELLMTFIPATVVGTPIGNFLQDHLPSDILRTVVGVVITALICYQLTKIIPKSELYQRRLKQHKKNQDKQEANHQEEEEERDDEKNVIKNNDDNNDMRVDDDKNMATMMDEEDQISSKDEENQCVKEHSDEDNAQQEEKNFISPDPLALIKNKNGKVKEQEEQQGLKEEATVIQKPNEDENIPTGKKLRIWGFVLGLLSGFLGGLMGVRGPPLMVFFLMFAYPKNIVRANAVLILLVNVGIRIAYYVIEDLSGQRKGDPWFDSDYTVMYVCCIVFGMLGVPIGDYVATKMNQDQFKLLVAFLLLFSGLSNMIKGSISLAT